MHPTLFLTTSSDLSTDTKSIAILSDSQRLWISNVYLKCHLRGQPALPFAAGSRSSSGRVQRRGNDPEGRRVCNVDARIAVMRRVRGTEHLRPDLQLHALRQLEVAKDAGVQLEQIS